MTSSALDRCKPVRYKPVRTATNTFIHTSNEVSFCMCVDAQLSLKDDIWNNTNSTNYKDLQTVKKVMTFPGYPVCQLDSLWLHQLTSVSLNQAAGHCVSLVKETKWLTNTPTTPTTPHTHTQSADVMRHWSWLTKRGFKRENKKREYALCNNLLYLYKT